MRIWHFVRLGFVCLMPWHVSDTLGIMGDTTIADPTITAAGLAAGGLGTAAALTLTLGVLTSSHEFADVVDMAFSLAICGATVAGATTIAGWAL